MGLDDLHIMATWIRPTCLNRWMVFEAREEDYYAHPRKTPRQAKSQAATVKRSRKRSAIGYGFDGVLHGRKCENPHPARIGLGVAMSKDAAHRFLKAFQESFERDLVAVKPFGATVRQRALAAKNDAKAPHLRRPEEVFLNEYAIPRLFQELQSNLGLSIDNARAALLSENFRHMPAMCSGTPARAVRHPFDKTLAPDPHNVIKHWRSGRSNALRQSCPDLALRAPCPYSIVFEGKYFDRGSLAKAEAELVRSIYQAFFYRALPKVAGSGLRPSWDYEFACLLACDASPDGVLQKAWNSLPQVIQEGFWEGANVFVMVVSGES